MLLSQLISPSPSPAVSTSLFYVCVSIPNLQKVLGYDFSRCHTYALILTSLIIRDMQIKTTMKHQLTLVRMVIIKKSINNKCWRGCGGKRTLLHYWWRCKLIQPLWRTVWRFLQNLYLNLWAVFSELIKIIHIINYLIWGQD